MARDRAGHVNRAFRGLKFKQDLPTTGAQLIAGGKSVGVVTSVAASPRLGTVGLGYVRRGQEAPGTILDVDAAGSGRAAEVAALPMT